ncbi:cell division inhibitor protein [Salmonella enterica]|uniref:Cell division inhibitor protein n=1 Tax=Salmonella enterica TaxID=28901 RepID=A0A7U5YQG3_SALER|nr:cell division inhibitor protein [Salmonella enterica]AXD71511.1 cell division inhibitor protein [Salmonella enterica]ECP4386491.1 cell division inhibitor protein [Salmonella enterica]EII9564143.1 cell division inhibitor protein [Salmonella enterica]
MKHQHYGTMEVIRQCVIPGTMVKYNGLIYKATTNTGGKLTLTNTRKNITVRDLVIEAYLDGKGELLTN